MCLKQPQRSHHWIFSNMLRPTRVKRTRYPRNASASRDMPLFSMDEDFEYGETTRVGARVIRRVHFDEHVITYGFVEIDEDMMRDEDPETEEVRETEAVHEPEEALENDTETKEGPETKEDLATKGDLEAYKELFDTESQSKQSAKTRWPERGSRRFTPVDWDPGYTYAEERYPPRYFAIPLSEGSWTDEEDWETEDEGVEETRPDEEYNNQNTIRTKNAGAARSKLLVVGFEGLETLVEMPADKLKKTTTGWTQIKLEEVRGVEGTKQPAWEDEDVKVVIISSNAHTSPSEVSFESVFEDSLTDITSEDVDSSSNDVNIDAPITTVHEAPAATLFPGSAMLKSILAWVNSWGRTAETTRVPSTTTTVGVSGTGPSRSAMRRLQFDY